MTQTDFAASVDCDQSAYSKVELGKKPLNINIGVLVADRWNVSLDYLYRGRLDGLREDVLKVLREIETGKAR